MVEPMKNLLFYRFTVTDRPRGRTEVRVGKSLFSKGIIDGMELSVPIVCVPKYRVRILTDSVA